MLVAVSSQDLAEQIGEVDGAQIVVWDGTEASAPDRLDEVELWVPPYATSADAVNAIDRLPRVRVVQLQSAGFDGVPELLPEGVLLCNAQGVHDDPTAEHAVGLILASLRGIPEAVRQHGHWSRMPGRRSLADSRVLILGYGSIGRAVAERLLPMKAQVSAVASSARDDALVGRVHGIEELPDLLGDQHVVVVLVPLNDATHHLVDADFLRRLADGALVVNISRGGVVDQDAVIAEAGRLAFALDVTDPEPLPDGDPLWTAPGVLITPHLGGGTTAMLPRMAELVRAQIERLAAGDRPLHVVAGD